MVKNMTEGNPLKLILEFSFPLLLGNLFQQTYNVVDSAIVGRTLGADALGAVGSTASVQFLVLGFCIGICSGFAIPVAQRFGAGDLRGMRRDIFHSEILTAVCALILTVVCSLFCGNILHLLQVPDNIFDDSYRYLLVIFLGIPFTLLYNLLSSMLRAVGDSRAPFLFLAFSAFLNILLDLFCILVLKMGCAGAAAATVISQAVSGVLCFCFIQKKVPTLQLAAEDRQFYADRALRLFAMGAPMGLQYSITAIGSMVMQASVNALGSIYVSGFTAGMKIKQFALGPFDAVATGVSTFSGQNYGAGEEARVRRGIRIGVVICVIYAIVMGIFMIFGGRFGSLLFVSADEGAVLDASAQYLRCIGFMLWLLAFLNVCRMSTQALGFSGRAIFSGVVEMFARVGVCLLAAPKFGWNAICWADQAAWISASCYIVPTCIWCIGTMHRRKDNPRDLHHEVD